MYVSLFLERRCQRTQPRHRESIIFYIHTMSFGIVYVLAQSHMLCDPGEEAFNRQYYMWP